jgi:uncharacterized protein YndB with AHSA1/START domain
VLIIVRDFEAPRSLVWKYWTEADLFKRWWAPETYTAPVMKIDLRVGGKYLGCMRAPDGTDTWSTGEYKEIKEGERLVMTDHFADAEGNIVSGSYYKLPGVWNLEMLINVSFKDVNGKTRMTLNHYGLPAGEMADMTGLGWSSSFDKLEAELNREQAPAAEGKTTFTFISDKEILVTRIFNAPRELVFKVYTDPELLPRWWGPAIYETIVEKMDVRPGGSWRFIHKDKEGKEYAFHGDYREVQEPERIVQTFIYEGMPDHALLETISMESLGGNTKVISSEQFASKEDRDGMWATGMEWGTSESMERFAAVLKALKK